MGIIYMKKYIYSFFIISNLASVFVHGMEMEDLEAGAKTWQRRDTDQTGTHGLELGALSVGPEEESIVLIKFLPSAIVNDYHCQDLDGCRLIYLSKWNARCCSVPEELVGTFAEPSGKSRKLTWYSGAVITSIGVTALAACFYGTFFACSPDDSEDYACNAQNNFISIGITSLGGISANIIGQWIYDRRLNKYEGKRNRAQDSALAITKIYRDIAKFVLRTYLMNLSLAKEARDMDIDSVKHIDTNSVGWEIGLDGYLNNRSVKFAEIFNFLRNWDQVKADLATRRVKPATIAEISSPIEQLHGLLLDDNAVDARAAIHDLVFTNVPYPNTVAVPIFDIITDEDLASIIQRIVR